MTREEYVYARLSAAEYSLNELVSIIGGAFPALQAALSVTRGQWLEQVQKLDEEYRTAQSPKIITLNPKR